MAGYRGEPLRQALGARLKAARRAAGLTQAQAAAAIGTTRTNLTMWELGYHDIGYSRLIKMVVLYRMDPATVFDTDLPALETE